MDTVKVSVAGLESIKDLKPLLTAEGPCLSLYMPLAATPAGQASNLNPLRWRELVDSLQKDVAIWGSDGVKLLESVADFETVVAGSDLVGRSIAVLRSPDVFRVVLLQHEVGTEAGFGPQFRIRPLLLELTRGKSFYLLALSQANVRLLHCTLTSSEEVPLGEGVITNFDRFMNSTEPDHARVMGAAVGPSGGSARTTVATTTSERESRDQFLSHFFKQIDRGVAGHLKGSHEPLITVGVDYEHTFYKRVNSYPNLLEEGVNGAANGLKSGEMQARALEVLNKSYEAKVDDVLADYNHRVGAGASNRLKDVVTAAHDGRVLNLVIADRLSSTGSFDPATNQVKASANGDTQDRDLINDAAIQTILHAGNVFVSATSKMPDGSPVAAVFRY
jgi:hypothetical protein